MSYTWNTETRSWRMLYKLGLAKRIVAPSCSQPTSEFWYRWRFAKANKLVTTAEVVAWHKRYHELCRRGLP